MMIHAQGYSMRTDDFRYTEWAKWDGRTQRPVWEVRAQTNIGKSQSQCTAREMESVYIVHAVHCD
jgi:hypothetical protein